MRCLLLFVMVFPLLMVSCSRGGKELVAKLHLADSLIEAEPDSGLAFLVSLCGQAEDASKANRYRYQLLLAKAKNQAYVPITTDSILREVAGYYDDHGSANQKMMAHYLLGCSYRDMGDLPQALLQYEEAVAKADTASEDCDFKTLSRVYGQAAEIYYKMYMPQNTLEASWNYIKYGLRAKDSVSIISGYNYIADAYNLTGKIDSQIYYGEKASALYLKAGKMREAAMSLGPLIEAYIDMGKPQKALQCLNRYEKESGLFDKNGNIEKGREIFYYGKGSYYLYRGTIDSAIVYFKKLNNNVSTANEKYAAAIGLSQAYQKLGMLDSALYYTGIRQRYSNHITNALMEDSYSKIKASYVHQKLNEDIYKSELKAGYMTTILVACISLTIIAGIIIGIYIKNKNEKARQRNEQYEQDNAGLVRVQEELHMLLTKKEEEEEELIAQKQEQINQLQERIEKMNASIHASKTESRIDNADIVIKFHHLGGSPKQHPSDDDWLELRKLVDKEIPAFRRKMDEKVALRPEEYNISMLVCLRFKPYEIINIMNLTAANVSTIRKRLLLKIFGEEGGAQDFDHKIWRLFR